MDYIYDDMIDWKIVLCGGVALYRAGLTTQATDKICAWTKIKCIDGLDAVAIKYWYKEDIDYEHYVSPSPTNPLILVPTKERALVEYILCEEWCDEGTLIEALKTYVEGPFVNMDELYKVANFFGLDKETLDYWIKEAREDPGY